MTVDNVAGGLVSNLVSGDSEATGKKSILRHLRSLFLANVGLFPVDL